MTATADTSPHLTDLSDLGRLSDGELEALFRRSPAGAVPGGEAKGMFLFLPGTPLGRPIARALRLVWRGKAFDATGGRLANRVLPLGIRAFPARVYEGSSQLDAKPCVVLDYARMSPVIGMMRDELREVAPGLYLGAAYWGRIRLFWFALQL